MRTEFIQGHCARNFKFCRDKISVRINARNSRRKLAYLPRVFCVCDLMEFDTKGRTFRPWRKGRRLIEVGPVQDCFKFFYRVSGLEKIRYVRALLVNWDMRDLDPFRVLDQILGNHDSPRVACGVVIVADRNIPPLEKLAPTSIPVGRAAGCGDAIEPAFPCYQAVKFTFAYQDRIVPLQRMKRVKSIFSKPALFV